MSPKPPLTHFLCIPLVTNLSRLQLQASISRLILAETVGNDADAGNGIDTDDAAAAVTRVEAPQLPLQAIRPPAAIHLTLGVMSLQTPERIQAACDFMRTLDVHGMVGAAWERLLVEADNDDAGRPSTDAKEVQSKHASTEQLSSPAITVHPRPLVVSLASLRPMQSPSSSSTLYAEPEPLQPLLFFAQALRDCFLSAGFLLPETSPTTTKHLSKRQQHAKDVETSSVLSQPNESVGKLQLRPLKLHATIVSTIYASREKKAWRTSKGGTAMMSRNRAGKGQDPPASLPSEQDPIAKGEASSNGGRGQNRKSRSSKMMIDARDLIERYRDIYWARDVQLDRIAICEMGAKNVEAPSPESINVEDTTSLGKWSEARETGGNVSIDKEYREICQVSLP